MNRILWFATIVTSLAAAIFAGGCSAQLQAGPTETPDDVNVEVQEEELGPRSVLAKAVLTTAVDERRYRPAAPEQTTFDEKTPIIYLVGKLRSVPADASIAVRWQREGDVYPLLTSKIGGSAKLQFIASLRPDQVTFSPGTYFARIDVNDREVGAVRFFITGKERAALPIKFKKLRVSENVDKKMRPRKAKKKFRKGTQQIYATFVVQNAPAGSQANLIWWRNGKEFHEETLNTAGEHHKAAMIRSDGGLPPGQYKVTVDVDGTPYGSLEFQIGKPISGPGFDAIVIGTEQGQNNMPIEELNLLPPDTLQLFCGLSFVDLEAGSVILVQWTALKEDGETVAYTNRLTMPSAGTGTMGVSWSPHENLPIGPYKVRVLLDDQHAGEINFFVGSQEEFDAYEEQRQEAAKADKKNKKHKKRRAKR